MQSFEMAGRWWLPEHPDDQTVGILRYEQDEGFKLEIPFGHLGNRDQFVERMNNPQAIPLVYGHLQNGKAATLVDLHCTNIGLAMPGTGREEHFTSLGFLGAVHVSKDPTIDKVRLQYAQLRDWVGYHPFTSSHREAAASDFSELEYRYKRIPERDLSTGADWGLKVGHTGKWPMPSAAGFTVSHDCYLRLELEAGVEYSEVDEQYLAPIWRFLCFCLDRMTIPTLTEVHLQEEEEWVALGRHALQKLAEEEVVHDPFMLLSLPRLGDRVAPTLKTWIELSGDERRATSLLVGLGRELDMPSDLKFLAAAQALEAMSRVEARETELAEAEFKKRLRAVGDALSSKLKKWAKRKLQYCNWRSASELTADLLEYIGPYSETLVPNRKKFLAELRDNRNFYTHRDDRRAGQVLDGADLYWLTQAVICVLKAAVLRRLGFDQEETKTIMENCQGTLRARTRVAARYGPPPPDEA